MMKKILSFFAILSLATTLMAGGDDRDLGPVESLDEMAPMSEQTVVGEQNAETMKLTDTSKEVIGTTPAGIPVTQAAHVACQDRLGLSDANIARFKEALSGGYLYNTGPIDALGTLFSPDRWADYFTCVETHGG